MIVLSFSSNCLACLSNGAGSTSSPRYLSMTSMVFEAAWLSGRLECVSTNREVRFCG